jgi:hypothetical protein
MEGLNDTVKLLFRKLEVLEGRKKVGQYIIIIISHYYYYLGSWKFWGVVMTR